MAFTMRDKLGALFSLSGQHFGAARFTLYCGLLLCSPFSGGYNASALQDLSQMKDVTGNLMIFWWTI
jgi:hypothetical protein